MKAYLEWDLDRETRKRRMNAAGDLITKKLRAKHPGLASLRIVAPKHDRMDLDVLVVHKNYRKQGIGSDVVNTLTNFTKKHKAKTVLYPVDKNQMWGTTSKARLVKFYKRHGFKKASSEIGGGYMVKEDARATPETIKTRRSRLASVLRGYLAARRAANQTANQIRGHGRSLERTDNPSKIVKSFTSIGVLGARLHSFNKKAGKHLKIWGRASMWQVSNPAHRHPQGYASRPRLNVSSRPANPRTYGNG